MAGSCYRRTSIYMGVFTLLQNFFNAYGVQHVPDLFDGALDFRWQLLAYFYAGGIVSVVGVVGATVEHALAVKLFACYLFVHAFLSIVPRLLAISIFPTIMQSICSADTINTWQVLASSPGHVEFYSVDGSFSRSQCQLIVGLLQILVVLVATLATLVQILMALRVRLYSRWLMEMQEHGAHESVHGDASVEKGESKARLLVQDVGDTDLVVVSRFQ